MAWLASLPFSTEGTDEMWLMSETAVSARMEVSIVLPKSAESIAEAMLSEPRLQEISLPIWL
ncbi:hypothetical protein D3C87_1958830 [compost metagenome]